MPALPYEILQYICDYAAERVKAQPGYDEGGTSSAGSDSRDIHFLALLGFSRASRRCRDMAAPYLFRRLKVGTVEQAALIVASPLLQYARHIHFPTVDALTCRRPLAAPVLRLVSQATSIRIAAAKSSFFFRARTPLYCLLRCASVLRALEVYCEPVSRGVDTLDLIADLIPACPRSLKVLYITMPGGEPTYSGAETLFDAIAPERHPKTDHSLPELEVIGLSVHLIPLLSSRPEQLALGIARRLPALQSVTFVAPSKNPRREISLLELVGPRVEPEGGFRQGVMRWKVRRDLDMVCAGSGDKLEQITSLEGSSGLGVEVLH